MEEINRLARPEILAMKPYSSARKEGAQTAVSIFLDAGENPYPPFPGGEAQHGLNRYPEPQPHELLDRFADHFGVPSDRLLITRGADESIDLLIRAFCTAGRDAILINPPTFGMYEISARVQDATVHRVPLRGDDGYQLDTAAILQAVDEQPAVKLVFVCTPNNPTGNLARRADVLRLSSGLLGRALVVADQTYVEFSGEAPLSHDLDAHPNLVVLRSLSKEFGLAGERCGLTVAHPDVIDILGRIIAPYPLTQSAVRAVSAAMTTEGVAYARANMRRIVAERGRVESALRRSPAVVRLHHSDANFLLFETPDPGLLVSMMETAGIKIRDRSQEPGTQGCVRVAIGLPEHNDRMLEILAEYAIKTGDDRPAV